MTVKSVIENRLAGEVAVIIAATKIILMNFTTD